MTIEIVNGLKKEVWYVLYHGYGWYETYGPSMTDMASYYNIDRLLKIEGKREIKLIENTLPQEIGSLYQLMKLILKEIEMERIQNTKDERLAHSINQVPLIEAMLRKLA